MRRHRELHHHARSSSLSAFLFLFLSSSSSDAFFIFPRTPTRTRARGSDRRNLVSTSFPRMKARFAHLLKKNYPKAATDTWEERFWSKVNLKGPFHPELRTRCHLWIAGKQSSGNGAFSYGGKMHGAHRVAWLIRYNRWPNPNALHRCGTPLCVNVEHLYEGATKLVAARSDPGHSSSRKKLSDADVTELRRRHWEDGVSAKELANFYGVTYGYTWLLLHSTRRSAAGLRQLPNVDG